MTFPSMDGSVGWKCYPWMLSMDGGISSMDEIVIGGCHPWMTSTDEDDR